MMKQRGVLDKLAKVAKKGKPIKIATISSVVVLIAGLVLAVMGFSVPASSMPANNQALYSTSIDCQASVQPCMLYPKGGIVTIDKAVINKITDTLLFNIKAQVHTDQQASIQGSLLASAVLSADGLWEKVYLTTPEVSFTTAQDGSWVAQTTMQVDVAKLEDYIKQMEDETGINMSSYFLKIIPNVTGVIVLGSSTFPLQNADDVVLEITGSQMTLQAQVQSADVVPVAFPVQASKEYFSTTQPIQNSITLLWVTLSVLLVRWLAVLLIVLPLGYMAYKPVLKLLHSANTLPEEETIDKRNKSRIIAIRGGDALQNKPTVELQSFAKLSTMADQKELPLLKMAENGSSVYLVIDTGLIYRYAARSAADKEQKWFEKGEGTVEYGVE